MLPDAEWNMTLIAIFPQDNYPKHNARELGFKRIM